MVTIEIYNGKSMVYPASTHALDRKESQFNLSVLPKLLIISKVIIFTSDSNLAIYRQKFLIRVKKGLNK